MSEKPKRGDPKRAAPRAVAARPRKSGGLAAAPQRGRAATPDDQQPRDLTALIRERAYVLYESCGCRGGHDLDHWLQAERELTARHDPEGGGR